jgi:hypothetical protein
VLKKCEDNVFKTSLEEKITTFIDKELLSKQAGEEFVG